MIIPSHRTNHRTAFRLARPTKAFTLIEVMVAVSVFAIAVAGALSLLTFQGQVIQRTQERTYMARVLDTVMEELRNYQTWDELEALGGGETVAIKPGIMTIFPTQPADAGIPVDAFARDVTNPVCNITITNLSASLKKVQVEVTWNSRPKNKPVSLKLTSYMAEDGMRQQ